VDDDNDACLYYCYYYYLSANDDGEMMKIKVGIETPCVLHIFCHSHVIIATACVGYCCQLISAW